VRRRITAISLDTVYRTLRLFEGKRLLSRVSCSGDRARFDANTDRHHHFICTKCGGVRDFYSEAGASLRGGAENQMKEFHDLSACPPARLPKNPKDVRAILEVLLKAEQCAVRGYTNICNLTVGKDHRTYELALGILNEEIEHEAWFAEFLGMGPSGHFRRRQAGESPFVSKFLHP